VRRLADGADPPGVEREAEAVEVQAPDRDLRDAALVPPGDRREVERVVVRHVDGTLVRGGLDDPDQPWRLAGDGAEGAAGGDESRGCGLRRHEARPSISR